MKGDLDRTLQKISQLRSLIQTLPHIPTRREEVLLEIFERVSRPGVPSEQKEQNLSVEALRAGFQACWRARRFETFVTVGDRIRPGPSSLRSDPLHLLPSCQSNHETEAAGRNSLTVRIGACLLQRHRKEHCAGHFMLETILSDTL